MNSVAFPAQQIHNLFDNYARALEQYDTKGLAFLCARPCTMISGENTTVFNDVTRLEGFFNTGATFYRQFGIAHVRPEVWSGRSWTNSIAQAKVNWYYMDVFKNPIYDCEYQYVLKLDKNKLWKIFLSVSVNEKEQIEKWGKLRSPKASFSVI